MSSYNFLVDSTSGILAYKTMSNGLCAVDDETARIISGGTGFKSMRIAFILLTLLLLGCSKPGTPEQKTVEQKPKETSEAKTSSKQALPFKFERQSTLGDDQEFSNPVATAIHPEGILVLDYKDCRVICLNEKGETVFSFGGKGEGPGEFQRPLRMFSTATSIWVYDLGTHMLSGFNLKGEFEKQVKVERVCAGIDGVDDRFIYNYYHQEGLPDVEIKDAQHQTIASISLESADANTYYATLALHQGEIYLAPLNHYIIEKFKMDGTPIGKITRPYTPPEYVEFAQIGRSFTVAAISGMAFHENHLLVLHGGHQDIYEQITGTELENPHLMQIDVFDAEGKWLGYHWPAEIPPKMKNIYNSPVFSVDAKGVLWLQDTDDIRLIHQFNLSSGS